MSCIRDGQVSQSITKVQIYGGGAYRPNVCCGRTRGVNSEHTENNWRPHRCHKIPRQRPPEGLILSREAPPARNEAGCFVYRGAAICPPVASRHVLWRPEVYNKTAPDYSYDILLSSPHSRPGLSCKVHQRRNSPLVKSVVVSTVFRGCHEKPHLKLLVPELAPVPTTPTLSRERNTSGCMERASLGDAIHSQIAGRAPPVLSDS